jgi:ABC-type antimicrobial peptide transport system permease subunit
MARNLQCEVPMRALRITFRTAVRALRRNVLRSVLTCLGIIIGIAAVIALVEIGHGATVAIQTSIAKFGANIVMIFPGESTSSGVSSGAGTVITLTPEDCQAIADECPAVRAAAPNIQARLQVVYGNRNWQPNSMYGTMPEYLDVGNWTIDQGEPFTERDVLNANLVCLIGQTMVRELFDDEPPIGKSIRVRNVNLRVIGTLASKGAALSGWDQDDVFIAPWTTVKYRLSNSTLAKVNQSTASAANSATAVNSLKSLYPGSSQGTFPAPSSAQAADTPQAVRFENIDQIIVSVKTPGEIPAAIHQITELLRQRHRLAADAPDDFRVLNIAEFAGAFASTSILMTNLLLCVAAVSLMVGGVGIMNIMLVSVTERTREIGLRMAVGARARDILRQFVVEAILLCLLGGVIGIILGRGMSLLVQTLLHWPIAMSISAILTALGVSAGVGLAFGYYPAWKASRLDPIDALRFE